MALDKLLREMSGIVFVLVPMLGVFMMIFAITLVMKKLLSPYSGGSWAAAIMALFAGSGLLIGGSGLFVGARESEEAEPSASSSPTPEPTPSPTPEPSPSPAETSQSAPDPISLPEIENSGTILVALGVVVVALVAALVLYVLIKRIVVDVRRARRERAELAVREARLAGRWQAIVDRHADLKQRYLDAETDWDMLFSYPALTDVTVPETAAMVKAMRSADDADPERPGFLDDDVDLSALAYPKAVNEFAVAWEAALRNARKVGQSGVPEEERRTIRRIRSLLAMAENCGSSENERAMAYSQAHALMRELRSITVPETALHRIEERKRLMLTA